MCGPHGHAYPGLHQPILADLSPTPKTLETLYGCAVRKDTHMLDSTRTSTATDLPSHTRCAETRARWTAPAYPRRSDSYPEPPSNSLWTCGPQRHAHAGLHQPTLADLSPTPATLETSYGLAVRRDKPTLDSTRTSTATKLPTHTRSAETRARWTAPAYPRRCRSYPETTKRLRRKPLDAKPIETSYGRAVRRDTRTLDCASLSGPCQNPKMTILYKPSL